MLRKISDFVKAVLHSGCQMFGGCGIRHGHCNKTFLNRSVRWVLNIIFERGKIF